MYLFFELSLFDKLVHYLINLFVTLSLRIIIYYMYISCLAVRYTTCIRIRVWWPFEQLPWVPPLNQLLGSTWPIFCLNILSFVESRCWGHERYCDMLRRVWIHLNFGSTSSQHVFCSWNVERLLRQFDRAWPWHLSTFSQHDSTNVERMLRQMLRMFDRGLRTRYNNKIVYKLLLRITYLHSLQ